MRRVAVEIDEDVDALVPDPFRQLFVGECRDRDEMLDQCTEVRRSFVIGREIIKGVDFESLPIVMRQQRLHEHGHDVAAKIRRNIADL